MAPRAASKTEPSDKVGVICRALRRAIIEQALEPGAKLPEDSLEKGSASAAPSPGMPWGNSPRKASSNFAATGSPW